jgi:hypothetical protein
MMKDSYLSKKAAETAETIVKSYDIDFPTALVITRNIWEEARRCILKIIGSYGVEGWQKLSLSDRAAVCSIVVRGLMDKGRLLSFMAGERRTIV